jgi:hypothetical protein
LILSSALIIFPAFALLPSHYSLDLYRSRIPLKKAGRRQLSYQQIASQNATSQGGQGRLLWRSLPGCLLAIKVRLFVPQATCRGDTRTDENPGAYLPLRNKGGTNRSASLLAGAGGCLPPAFRRPGGKPGSSRVVWGHRGLMCAICPTPALARAGWVGASVFAGPSLTLWVRREGSPKGMISLGRRWFMIRL